MQGYLLVKCASCAKIIDKVYFDTADIDTQWETRDWHIAETLYKHRPACPAYYQPGLPETNYQEQF